MADRTAAGTLELTARPLLSMAILSLFIGCAAAPKVPRITGFEPTTGKAGTTVTIEGENFDPDPAKNQVLFADNQQAEVRSASITQIQAVVPPEAIPGVIIVRTEAGTAVTTLSFDAPKGPCAEYPGEGSIVIEIKNCGFAPTACAAAPGPVPPNECIAPFSMCKKVSFVPNPQYYVYYHDVTGDLQKEIELYGYQPTGAAATLDMFFGALPCIVSEVKVAIRDNMGTATLEGTDDPGGTAHTDTSPGQGDVALSIKADPGSHFNGVRLSGEEVLFFEITLD